ncbi:MAG: electron transfer flavoprotein subunit alpha/FixB family protein [Ignavibacteria bacterium]|nr:electron transfer flavoprotein subunit alpha/FixB family protein [Ignavibacteria bacterium]
MKILAFAEQRENEFKKSAFEVVRAAKTIAEQGGGEVLALVIGNCVAAIAPILGGFGAARVIVAEDPKLATYSTTAYAKIVSEVAKKEGVTHVFLPASSLGKDLAPRVAVRLEAGLASDCTALTVDGGEVIASRPVYAGKAITDVKVTSAVKVFSLRPNVFSAGSSNGTKAPVETSTVPLSDADFASRVVNVSKSEGRLDVTEADIVVSGGRGLKGPENFKMIEELASALGAAVGASRAVVDAGWRPHDEQVGQTGKTVSPTLYIAVAISGAIQHLAGISSSKYIVAVNKDKDAPIFQVADYGIVGDAFEIVPALTQEVKRVTG